jgi:hypothetical protein
MKIVKSILICLFLCIFTSCITSDYVYDAPIKYTYITTNYYDYNTGISVVYINNMPYYQYYDVKYKYWYRKPVPKRNYHRIAYKHKPSNFSYRSSKPHPHNKLTPRNNQIIHRHNKR